MSLDLPKMSLIGLILADMRLIYARMMICLFFKHEQGVDPGWAQKKLNLSHLDKVEAELTQEGLDLINPNENNLDLPEKKAKF